MAQSPASTRRSVQRRFPAPSFVLTTTATAAEALTLILGARNGPHSVDVRRGGRASTFRLRIPMTMDGLLPIDIVGRVVPSARGANVYVRLHHASPWALTEMMLLLICLASITIGLHRAWWDSLAPPALWASPFAPAFGAALIFGGCTLWVQRQAWVAYDILASCLPG
jgi:hypothetical protein